MNYKADIACAIAQILVRVVAWAGRSFECPGG
jgi:hypothetical protein